MAFGIDDAVAVGLKLIDKWFPSESEKNAAKLQLLDMQQKGDFKEWDMLAQSDKNQSEVNLAEAQSESVLKSGWRPFIGWTCGAAFAIEFVVAPFATWAARLMGKTVEFPTLDMTQLLPVLFGMLGLGAYRTYEKVKAK